MVTLNIKEKFHSNKPQVNIFGFECNSCRRNSSIYKVQYFDEIFKTQSSLNLPDSMKKNVVD